MAISKYRIMEKGLQVLMENKPTWDMVADYSVHDKWSFFFDDGTLHCVRISWSRKGKFPKENLSRAEFEDALMDGIKALPKSCTLGNIAHHIVSLAVDEESDTAAVRIHYYVNTTELV